MSRALRSGLLFCLLLSCVCLQACLSEKAKQLQLQGTTMGTNYSVTVVEPQKDISEGLLKEQIESELARINKLISTYDPESELSEFNASSSTAWAPLAADTIKLIQSARQVSNESNGAYDVTLASLSELWGFGTSGDEQSETEQAAEPDLDAVLELMNEVGYQLLQVSGTGTTVRKLTPHLQVDLSSIGKGFAVDQVGLILEAAGIDRYLVDIGGEIRTRGLAVDGEMWKIGIEVPQTGASDASAGVAVEAAHIATSGDYRNFREVDGKRLSHLIDGRTGFPIEHNLASVTLLHGSTALADAWATAFMALGYEQASEIAAKKGIAAQFTLRKGDSFEVLQSKAFAAYAYSK